MRRNERNPPPWAQREQVPITSEDHFALRIQGKSEQPVVVRVAAIFHAREYGNRPRNPENATQELLSIREGDVTIELLPGEHVGQFLDQRVRHDHFMVVQGPVDGTGRGDLDSRSRPTHAFVSMTIRTRQGPSNSSSFSSVKPRARAASDTRSQKRWNSTTLAAVSRL